MQQRPAEFTTTVVALEDAIVAFAADTPEKQSSPLDVQLLQQHQKSWVQLVDLYQTLRQLMAEIDQSTYQQSASISNLQQRVVEIANRTNQSSTKVNAIVTTIGELQETTPNP